MTAKTEGYSAPQMTEYGSIEEITLSDKCGDQEDDVGFQGLDGSIVPDDECDP